MRAERDEIVPRRNRGKRRQAGVSGPRLAMGLVLLALLVWAGLGAYRHANLLSDPARLLQGLRFDGKPIFASDAPAEAPAPMSAPRNTLAPTANEPSVNEYKEIESVETRRVDLK